MTETYSRAPREQTVTRMQASGCPVSHTDYRLERPMFETYDLLEADREAAPVLWNDSTANPFWMVTRYDQVVEALQQPDVFGNEVISALNPAHHLDLIPQYLNPPEHTAMRRALNRWFSPAAVRRLEPEVLARCTELIDEIAPTGSCDLVSDFAIRFPTDMFLRTLNLPLGDGAEFLVHVEKVFTGFAGRELEEAAAGAAWIQAYFDEKVAEREKDPLDIETDFISRMLVATVDGEAISRPDVVTICVTLMLAGLDTTRSALGYIFHHLATHPDLRHRLTADPSLWPKAVEEFIRMYPLVFQAGRLVKEDVEFHGVSMKAGDIAWLGLATANFDPDKFSDSHHFELGRDDLNHHLAFGAGVHRCLGMHLARHELVIALEEWHRRVPDYTLGDAEIHERGAQLSIDTLPLSWTTEASA